MQNSDFIPQTRETKPKIGIIIEYNRTKTPELYDDDI